MNAYSEDKMYEKYSSEVERMQKCIDELQQENQELKKQLQEELEWTIGIVEHNRIISEKNKEIHQLKDNWNKLKEYIKETKLKEFEKSYGKRYGKTFTQAEIIVCNMILNKMQELQG